MTTDTRPVLVIGDSIAIGAFPMLNAAINGVHVDAAIGRQPKSILQALNKVDVSKYRAIVLELGTNGAIDVAQLDSALAKITDVDVVLVTNYAPRIWIDTNNAIIKRMAAKYPNVTLARWDTVAASPNGGVLEPDGIHPNEKGRVAFAGMVSQSIKR